MKYSICLQFIAFTRSYYSGTETPVAHGPRYTGCENLLIIQLAVACLAATAAAVAAAAGNKANVSDGPYCCSQNRHTAIKMTDALPTSYRVPLSSQLCGGKYKYYFFRDVMPCRLVNVC